MSWKVVNGRVLIIGSVTKSSLIGSTMRAGHRVVVEVLLAISISRQLPAQQQPAPRSRVALDVGLLSAGLSYARTTGPGKRVGGEIGAGFDFNIRLVPGESWGVKSTEILHFAVFERLEPPGPWQYDVGIKVAADIHTADVHSEASLGGFTGGYFAPMWGGPHFRIGPRIQGGAYWTSPHPTPGISITPLTARLLF